MNMKNSGRSFTRHQVCIIGLGLAASLVVGLLLAVFTHQSKSVPITAVETQSVPETTQPPETEPPITEPAVDVSDWRLVVANPWQKLPEDFTVTLKKLPSGHQVDERCYEDLQAMMEACKAAGMNPYICSSYRSQEKQEALYANKVQRVMNQGYDYEEALEVAATEVARPGTSEHQTGLTLDIVDREHIVLDETQEARPTQQWLMEHSWEYGFILRYPPEKSSLTGIIYEPWHYRYVGREYAKEIHDQGVCLEEFVGFTCG